MLDDLFQRAADADEPEDQNFIKQESGVRSQESEFRMNSVRVADE
ncbi:hypothetical protein [Nostoc sp.]